MVHADEAPEKCSFCTTIAIRTPIACRCAYVALSLSRMYLSLPGAPWKRGVDDLAEAQITRLRLLNQKLAEVERWILQLRDQRLGDYFRAGGVKDQRHSDERHPDYDEEDDPTVCSRQSIPLPGNLAYPASWQPRAVCPTIQGEGLQRIWRRSLFGLRAVLELRLRLLRTHPVDQDRSYRWRLATI